jgi:hypothetical protein
MIEDSLEATGLPIREYAPCRVILSFETVLFSSCGVFPVKHALQVF